MQKGLIVGGVIILITAITTLPVNGHIDAGIVVFSPARLPQMRLNQALFAKVFHRRERRVFAVIDHLFGSVGFADPVKFHLPGRFSSCVGAVQPSDQMQAHVYTGGDAPGSYDASFIYPPF